MRHRVKGKILGLKKNKRKALIKSLVHSLLNFKKIKTTKIKAKETKKAFDRLMAKAQNQTLATIRYLRKTLSKEDVAKIMALAKTYEHKIGGYTRIVNLKPRIKDGAQMALLQIINQDQPEKKLTTNNQKEQSKTNKQ